MLELAGRFLEHSNIPDADSIRKHYRISTNPDLPQRLTAETAFLCNGVTPTSSFSLYLAIDEGKEFLERLPSTAPKAVLPNSAAFLRDGDIILVSPAAGTYRVAFRSGTRHQSVLLTERCNHYCLMCSQPPRDVEDDWLIEEAERLIPMLPTDTRELGITGGEPTIYGERLLSLLRLTNKLLPRTAVHVLSNGRRFSDRKFARAYADVSHHDLMVGIPIYSDDPSRHNFVVQSDGAFDETISGILNLKELEQRVEIRIVLHAQTIERLPRLAEFIARNLLFVDQVALMGLEITGFTRGNLRQLWIDPFDYKEILQEAVSILAAYRVPTAVYNHQLCVVAPSVRPYAVKSISDWKNEYLPECSGCEQKAQCGGFFSSAVKYKHSAHIEAVRS